MTCPGPQPGARTEVSCHALGSPPKPCFTPHTSPATRANVCVGTALSGLLLLLLLAATVH